MTEKDSCLDPLPSDPADIAQSNMWQALCENQALFQQVWHNASDAMALSDAEGIVLAANPAYLHLYGYTLEEVIGKSFAIIFPDEERQSAVEQYKTIFSSEVTSPAYEAVVRRADSTERIVEANPTFLTEAGKRTIMLSMIRDITERKQHEDQLRQLNKTLEARVEKRQAQLRTLASRLIVAEHEERRRISQILHDELQQILYAIQVRVQFIMKEAEGHETDVLITNVRTILDLLHEALGITRHLTIDFSPPLLKGEGFVEALPWLVNQMKKVHGLQVDLQVVQPFRILNEDMRVLLFQFLRELLFNVRKHAGVDHATVQLQEGEGELFIRVSDKGRGFDPISVKTVRTESFGLFSIQERLQLFGGHMEIESAPEQGTSVTIHLPTASA